MCTASNYTNNGHHYFGRNLDYESSYGEDIVILPQNLPLNFREAGTVNQHYAIIGIAYVVGDYPLLYDGANEKGLGMAGLNFVGNASYFEHADGKDNIAQFEFIPWILGQCATVAEAKTLLSKINLRNTSFSDQLPASELHWIISDGVESVVVESMQDGLHIHDNPAGVLTNNPPFNEQMMQLNNYQHLSAKAPANNFDPQMQFTQYSRGMGAIGLPGDLSSESRFAKVAFTRANSLSPDDELHNVSQFFHILHSVDQQRGCTDLGNNQYEITIYSDCYSLGEQVFYYTSYDNHQITAVDMKKADLSGNTLIRFPFIGDEQVNYQN